MPVPVTVVIPCYNSLRFLPDTVDSVLAQTRADLEVVLVDDGGTDDLAGWVAGCADPRVRLVRQDNAGPSAARNRGVAESRSPLVAFLDSDDLWEPQFLERLVPRLDDEAVGLVYSGYDVIDGEGRPSGRSVVSTWEGDVWERFVTRNPVACSGVVLRRSVFDEVGGFTVNRDRFPIDVEDWDLWVRIAAVHRVAVVAEVLVHHRRHGANTSTDPDSLAAAHEFFLENAFRDVPPERAALRPVAQARTELLRGWVHLVDRHDPAAALGCRRSAARHHPPVKRTPEYWRLGLAARALEATGERGFDAVRSANDVARRIASRLPLDRLRREGSFTP